MTEHRHEHRPDPEALLARVKAEEAREQSGHLMLFFGAAAGVGKTYAMLEAARALKAEGVDVVVGYIETHGRVETEALLEGLEILPAADDRLPRNDAEGVRPRRRARAPARGDPRRRARPHQCAGLPARQAVAGRARAARRRHQRVHDAQRPARGEPQRHRGQDHRRHRARDGARLRARARRPDRAGGPPARRAAPAPAGRQGLSPRAGAGGHPELLPQGKPDGAARARPAAHRRARGRGDAGLHARPRRRADLARERAHPRLREPEPALRPARARGPAPRHAHGRPVDRRLRRDARQRPPAPGRARPRRPDAPARRAARRRDGHAVRRHDERRDPRLCAGSERQQDRHRQARPVPLAADPARIDRRRAGPGQRGDRHLRRERRTRGRAHEGAADPAAAARLARIRPRPRHGGRVRPASPGSCSPTSGCRT